MSKQYRVTLGDGFGREIERHMQVAGYTNASDAVQTAVIFGIRQLMDLSDRLEEGEKIDDPLDQMRMLLTRLSAGETVSDEEIVMIAHDLDLPDETLKQIRDCLAKDKRRGRANATK